MLCEGKRWSLRVPTGELPAVQLPWHKITAAGKSWRNKTNPIKLAQDHVQEVGNVFAVFLPLLQVPNHCGSFQLAAVQTSSSLMVLQYHVTLVFPEMVRKGTVWVWGWLVFFFWVPFCFFIRLSDAVSEGA